MNTERFIAVPIAILILIFLLGGYSIHSYQQKYYKQHPLPLITYSQLKLAPEGSIIVKKEGKYIPLAFIKQNIASDKGVILTTLSPFIKYVIIHSDIKILNIGDLNRVLWGNYNTRLITPSDPEYQDIGCVLKEKLASHPQEILCLENKSQAEYKLKG